MGLRATGGTHRGLLDLFGLDPQDYKRFLNFLASHDCTIDFREFRGARHPLAETAAAGRVGR